MASLQGLVGAAGLGVTVKGFYTPGDLGSGDFYYDANYSGASIPGMAIRPSGTSIGGWRRKWTGKLQGGWFGIMANGINVDTAAWTAAINFAGANKLGSVQMPNGNILGVNFTCLYDSITIEGSGSTVLFMLPTISTANAAAINIFGRHAVTIQNLSINCLGFQGSSAFGNIGIRMNGDTTISFNNVTILNNTYTGFSFQNNCYDALIQGCHVINTDVCVHFIGSGIGSSKLRIIGNEFRDGTSEAITLQGIGGIPQTESIDFIISGNTISGKVNSSGIYLLYAKYGTVSNNTIFNCRAGISGSPSNVTRPDYTAHVIVTGNVIHGMINDGIGPMGNGSIVSNNILDSIGREGIQVGYYQDTSRHDTTVLIEGNILTHINYMKSANWGGMRIQNLRYSKIKNNIVYLGPGQETVTGIFAYKFIGNSDSSVEFEGNTAVDGPVASNSNKTDNYIVFRHNIVLDISINWAVSDSFAKKAVFDNNTYLSGRINGIIQPDANGFAGGINSFNPRTYYAVGSNSRIRVLEGTYSGRVVTLTSLFNGNTIVNGGNIKLQYLQLCPLDSGTSITLRYDGLNWIEMARTTYTNSIAISSQTSMIDSVGKNPGLDIWNGYNSLVLGADGSKTGLRTANTNKEGRIAMPMYAGGTQLGAILYAGSDSLGLHIRLGSAPPGINYSARDFGIYLGANTPSTGVPVLFLSNPSNAIYFGSSNQFGTAEMSLIKNNLFTSGQVYGLNSHLYMTAASGSASHSSFASTDSIANNGTGAVSGFLAKPRFLSASDYSAFRAENASGWSLKSISGNTMLWNAGSVNVGVSNSTGDPSAVLSVVSTIQGVLFPNMTTTQKLAIATPHKGLQVFDITLNQMSYYNGTAWVNF